MKPHSPSLKKELEELTASAEENMELARDYLTERGILHGVASRFRLGVVNDPTSSYHGRLSIPSIGPRGNVYQIRYRSLDDREPKYLGMPGLETRIFNVRAIKEAGDEIHITEGEMDSTILEACGFHSTGLTGANAWKRHHPLMFSGFSRVWIWGDGDAAGEGFARKVYESLTGATIVPVPKGQDVNTLFLEGGVELIRKVMGIDE